MDQRIVVFIEKENTLKLIELIIYMRIGKLMNVSNALNLHVIHMYRLESSPMSEFIL